MFTHKTTKKRKEFSYYSYITSFIVAIAATRWKIYYQRLAHESELLLRGARRVSLLSYASWDEHRGRSPRHESCPAHAEPPSSWAASPVQYRFFISPAIPAVMRARVTVNLIFMFVRTYGSQGKCRKTMKRKGKE